MDSLVVAAAALALIALAYWYSRRTPAVSLTPINPATALYTMSTGVWSGEPGGVYTCSPASSNASYCILPTEAAAVNQCTGDPKCLGYLYYTNSDTFGYQLFSQTPSLSGYATSVAMTKNV